ncbi:unnamed protein product, partial [Oppiella nova]
MWTNKCGKTPDARARTYQTIIKEAAVSQEEAELRKKLIDKSKSGELKAVSDDKSGKRRRWDQPQTGPTADEPPKKKSSWDYAEAATPAAPGMWDQTPGRHLTEDSKVPERWDPTPIHPSTTPLTPGHETPGLKSSTRRNRWDETQRTPKWDPTPIHPSTTPLTPGHETPGLKSSTRRNRWDETPKTERGETPGHVSGWAETPRADRGAELIQDTPTPGASKRRSRWDETPAAGGSMTPATPSMMTPSMTPITPSGATPMGPKAMAMATPSPGQLVPMTPEQMQAFRWEKEIDERNRPMTDDELDSLFPPGYKVLPAPAGYMPIRTPARKLTATPTPMSGIGGGGGFFIQKEE